MALSTCAVNRCTNPIQSSLGRRLSHGVDLDILRRVGASEPSMAFVKVQQAAPYNATGIIQFPKSLAFAKQGDAVEWNTIWIFEKAAQAFFIIVRSFAA